MQVASCGRADMQSIKVHRVQSLKSLPKMQMKAWPIRTSWSSISPSTNAAPASPSPDWEMNQQPSRGGLGGPQGWAGHVHLWPKKQICPELHQNQHDQQIERVGSALMRHHLECCIQPLGPQHRKDMKLLAWVQRRPKDALRAGAPPAMRQIERGRVIQPEEGSRETSTGSPFST